MKCALITGGTRGIGREIVRNYLQRNYKVIVNYSKSDIDAEKLISDFSTYKDNIITIKADLSTYDGMEKFMEKVLEYKLKLDTLILNVGTTKRENFEDISIDSWNNVMNSNLNIPFFIIQKLCNEINDGGRIIFISSILGIKADGISIQYGVSKGAIMILTKYLAKYFVDKNITVNCIAPGFIDTQWQLEKSEEHRRRIEEKILMKRFGTCEEVASMCNMIEENNYLTGQTMVIDGGYTL